MFQIKNPQQKLYDLAFKILHKYKSRIEMINTLYSIGVSKHECMILELLLLGKDLESIRKTLIFSAEHYKVLLEKLVDNLKNHDAKVKLYKKLKQ